MNGIPGVPVAPSLQQPYFGPFEPPYTLPPQSTMITFAYDTSYCYTQALSFTLIEAIPVGLPTYSTPQYTINFPGIQYPVVTTHNSCTTFTIFGSNQTVCFPVYGSIIETYTPPAVVVPPISLFPGLTFKIGGTLNLNFLVADNLDFSTTVDILTGATTDPTVVNALTSLNFGVQQSNIILYVYDINGNYITELPLSLDWLLKAETFSMASPTEIQLGQPATITLTGNQQGISRSFSFNDAGGISGFTTGSFPDDNCDGFFDATPGAADAIGSAVQNNFPSSIPGVPGGEGLSFNFNFGITPTVKINVLTTLSQLASQPPPTVTADLSSCVYVDLNVDINFSAPNPIGSYNYTLNETVYSAAYATSYTQILPIVIPSVPPV